jgi:hypothetical protein
MAERDVVPESGNGGTANGAAEPQVRHEARPQDSLTEGLPRQQSVEDAGVGIGSSGPIRVVRRGRQQTAALRQELAEKAAATDELREALDELRHVLDIENPPSRIAGRRRTRLVVAAIVGLIVLALLALVLFDRSTPQIVQPSSAAASGSPVASSGAGANGATASGATSAPASSGTASSGTAPSTHPMAWPGGAVLVPTGLVTNAPGAGKPGTDVQIAVDPDGTHVDVFERLQLGAATGRPLVLTQPSLPTLGVRVQISDLQIELDKAAVAPAADGDTAWSAAPAQGSSYTTATLRYRVANGVIAVTPAAPGRAFALVTPLSAAISQAAGNPVVVRAIDSHVLGVTCPTAPAASTVCGTRTATGWNATIPTDSRPIVLFQIDSNR